MRLFLSQCLSFLTSISTRWQCPAPPPLPFSRRRGSISSSSTSPVQPPTVNLACTSLFGQPRPCLFFSRAHFSSRDTTRGHVLQAFHRHVWPHVRPSWSEPPGSCVTYLGGTQPSSCVETHEDLTWTKKGRLPLFTLTNRDRASQRPFLHAGGGPSTWAVSTRKYPTVEAIVYAHISDLP